MVMDRYARGTQELAIDCCNADAPRPGGFAHWLIPRLPADVSAIPEAGGDTFQQGRNDFGLI